MWELYLTLHVALHVPTGAVHVLTLDPVPSGQLGSVEWVKQVHGDRAAAFRLFFGDQGDESVMATVLAEGARLPPHQPVPALWDAWWQSEGGYDLIIDDASHHPALQARHLALTATQLQTATQLRLQPSSRLRARHCLQ